MTQKLLNSGLKSKSQRPINFAEKDTINESGVKKLIQEAVALNTKR